MTLLFATQINGKPTNFVEKIQSGSKIHTIRTDTHDRWESGKMIIFSIWTGRPYYSKMFEFAPRLPVVSVQKVFMKLHQEELKVSIDDKYLNNSAIEELAINDGFDSVEDFERYFISQMKDNQYSGKIIHWTDFKY